MFDEESKKLLRAPSVVAFVEVDCPTTDVCANTLVVRNETRKNKKARTADTREARGRLHPDIGDDVKNPSVATGLSLYRSIHVVDR